MTYNELLLESSWYKKCIEILHRDQYRCQKCGALGFHNNAYYECQTADELDCFLKGILIKDDEPSVFIDKIKNSSTLWNVSIPHDNNDETNRYLSINDNILYDLNISRDVRSHPFILPTASKSIIQDTKCKGSYLPIDKKSVKISPEINMQYSTGCYFIFDNSYFDKPIVRIEKRWPTGCIGDEYGPIFWGSIIIGICFQECGISLEFMDDKSVIDINGNYLEVPIIPKALNVHHKYYVSGRKPWEYDNDALITLCQDCHCLEHKSTQTPVYKDLYNKQVMAYAEICDRCGGSGYLPQYHHVKGGICFKCYGEGVFVAPCDTGIGICNDTNN